MKLGALLASAGAKISDGADLDVRHLVYDSRQATPGSVFVAIKGFHRDGHDHAADAVARGAIAVVAERPVQVDVPVALVPDARAALADLAAELFDHPTRRLKLAAVTGTDGKTTTVHLVSEVLEAAGERTGFATTVDFKVLDHAWANETRQTTAEAVEVQEFFAEVAVAGGTWGVLEATSHSLALRKLRGCEVDVAIFTNISPEHLDFHGDLQSYLEAKAILFSELLRGDQKGGQQKTAVLNADDPHWSYLAGRATGARVVTYGIDALADVQGTVTREDASGSHVKINAFGARAKLDLPLVGRFNVHNALAACAAGLAAGATLDQARAALAVTRPVAGRMERISGDQPFAVIVDYAHTPASLEKVLQLLRPLTPGKLIAVFGSAGERDRSKRPVLAEIASRWCDLFVITQEDPRLDDREALLREIEEGATRAGKRRGRDYLVIDDRADAIATAIARAEPGDTVVLCGKGHERSIIEGEEKRPWNEAEVAREALRGRGFAA